LDEVFVYQLTGFMVVGSLGVVVNGVIYQALMRTSAGRRKVFSFLKVKRLEGYFRDITLAWCLGILSAFIFNFLLDKYLVFKV